MKILYHIPYPYTIGAEYWIYRGWKDAFIDLGHNFMELTASDNWQKKINEFKPDIFFGANLDDIKKYKNFLLDLRRRRIKVFLGIGCLMSAEELEIIKNFEIADIYFSDQEPGSMLEFTETTKRKYYVMHHAADKKIHFPTQAVAKYNYDIVYLGAKLPEKKWFFENVLIPLTKKYKVGIFGPCWTFRDNFLRLAAKFSKKIKFSRAVSFLNKFRVIIPENEENQLYSSAKISLNFHGRKKDNQPYLTLNQRTFKIPACGGFEICDYVPALRKYFNEDEIVVIASLNPQDWFNKIDYYLNHEKERKAIQEKGTARALKDHTYHNRVEKIVELYKSLPN